MSREPCHDLFQRFGRVAGRQGGAVDQDDGQAQGAGGDQFRFRAAAACVLGDDMGDGVVAQKGRVAGGGEGAFGDKGGAQGQGKRGLGRIDEAQQVVVLRFGGERLKRLLADGEEDACRCVGQGGDGGFGILHMRPAVAFARRPGVAFVGEKRGARFGAGGEGVPAHLCGEGVGGVDHMGDRLGADIGGEALGPAKAADAGGQGLCHGCYRAAGVGKDGIYAKGRQMRGKVAGFGRAAEQKDACHV